MEHARLYALNRSQRKCRSNFFLHPGLLALLIVICLFLVFYCWPIHYSAQSSSQEPGFPQTKSLKIAAEIALSQSADAAATFLGSKGRVDGTKRTGTREELTASSGKGGTEFLAQPFEDSVQLDGVSVSSEDSSRTSFSVRDLKPGVCGRGICNNISVVPNDFVFAVATHEHNEPTLTAGRAGRLGVRTYVSTNYTQTPGQSYPSTSSETWAYYPDDIVLRSFYAGDTRAALVPFLAYRDLGNTFKWVFYGDDDTIFFVDAAIELVKNLDPEMPYFLTDHFWFSNWNYGYPWHPHWRAPRCLPCHATTNVSQLRMNMVKACPCTPEAMCNLEDGYDMALDKRKCTPPRAPTLTYSMHGGAGALISIGMLKAVDFEEIEDCVLREWSTGGDSLITICLWKVGYGMTDPGVMWHPDGLTRFDPSPKKLVIDHTPYVIPRASYTIGNLLSKAAGLCSGLCQVETQHVLSLHLRGRLLTNSSNGAAALLRGVTRFYNLHTGRLQEAPDARSSALRDTNSASEKLAREIDELFSGAVKKLRDDAPKLKAMAAAHKTFPVNGSAALFMPSEAQKMGNGSIALSETALLKGGAAGIIQRVLEESVKKALAVFPPPPPRV